MPPRIWRSSVSLLVTCSSPSAETKSLTPSSVPPSPSVVCCPASTEPCCSKSSRRRRTRWRLKYALMVDGYGFYHFTTDTPADACLFRWLANGIKMDSQMQVIYPLLSSRHTEKLRGGLYHLAAFDVRHMCCTARVRHVASHFYSPALFLLPRLLFFDVHSYGLTHASSFQRAL